MRTRERHGMAGTPEYRAWTAMKTRCYNSNYDKSKNYLGRGITVCMLWRDSFVNFYRDMGDKPSPKHSLDRVDNNEGYSAHNCRWTDSLTQVHNRREFSGETGERYIHKNGEGYALRVNTKHYGTYKTLEDAVEARDQLIEESCNEFIYKVC